MRVALLGLWLLPPLAIWAVAQAWDGPEVLVTVSYRGSAAIPVVTSCTYLGLRGFVTRPGFGHCPWLRLGWEDAP